MTLVSQIIKDAYRQSNLLAITADPTTLQQTEALRYLNRIHKSVFGNEAGEQLEPFPLGRVDINRPAGYPWYNETPPGDWYVPKNQRLMCNLAYPATVYLHPQPDDGSRFAVIDVAQTLDTCPLSVVGNGRRIEAAETLVLSTVGLDAQWFYRGDLGNWLRLTSLDLTDEYPFPEEFDDFFITLLAMRLNPSYATALAGESMQVFARAKKQFQSRYNQHIEMHSEIGLIRMPRQAADRDGFNRDGWYGDPTSLFNRGYPY